MQNMNSLTKIGPLFEFESSRSPTSQPFSHLLGDDNLMRGEYGTQTMKPTPMIRSHYHGENRPPRGDEGDPPAAPEVREDPLLLVRGAPREHCHLPDGPPQPPRGTPAATRRGRKYNEDGGHMHEWKYEA